MYNEHDAQYEPARPYDVSQARGFFKTTTTSEFPLLNLKHQQLSELIKTPFWIGGGALTSMIAGDKINDWDIFTSDWQSVFNDLQSNAELTFENSHVANFSHKDFSQTIQLIKRDHESPQFTAQQIDLSICAGAFDGNNLVVHDTMIDDIDNNKIRLNQVKWPLSTLNRVMKYSQRGYTADIGVLVTLVHMIREADITDLTALSFYIEQEDA